MAPAAEARGLTPGGSFGLAPRTGMRTGPRRCWVGNITRITRGIGVLFLNRCRRTGPALAVAWGLATAGPIRARNLITEGFFAKPSDLLRI